MSSSSLLDYSKTYLSGPMELHLYVSDEFQKSITLIGDCHTKESQCEMAVSLVEFIYSMIDKANNNDTDTDVFLELPYLQQNLYQSTTSNDYFSDIARFFSSCVQYDKSNCPYKTQLPSCRSRARFHYSNVRTVYANSPIFNAIDVMTLMSLWNERDINKLYQNHITAILTDDEKTNYINKLEVLNTFIHQPLEVIEKQLLYELRDILKINKQLDYIPEPLHSRVIDGLHYALKQEDYVNIVQKYIPLLQTQIAAFTITDSVENIVAIFQTLLIIHYVEMDLYIIGRIFRIFGDGHTSKNIIIYSGAKHTLLQKKFFEYMNFTPVFRSYSKPPPMCSSSIPTSNSIFYVATEIQQCVDITDLIIPLFSHNHLFLTKEQYVNCYFSNYVSKMIEINCFQASYGDYNFIRTLRNNVNNTTTPIAFCSYSKENIFGKIVYYLYNVCTKKEVTRRRVISNLIQWSILVLAIQRVKNSENITEIYLDVMKDNDGAKELYSKMGFMRLHDYTYPTNENSKYYWYKNKADIGLEPMMANFDLLLHSIKTLGMTSVNINQEDEGKRITFNPSKEIKNISSRENINELLEKNYVSNDEE